MAQGSGRGAPIPAADYDQLYATRSAVRKSLPRVEFLRIDPGSERYAGAIEELFADQIGKVANGEVLSRRVAELYGQGNLETFDYRLMQNDPLPGEPPEYGLALTTRRNSWGPNYLRFGLQRTGETECHAALLRASRHVPQPQFKDCRRRVAYSRC